MLAFALAFRGAQTKTAASVQEALELWDHWEPNVLVSDIGMPIEDGYELIRRVRARDGIQIPAIALTGYASSEDAARVLAAGYQLHLPKPLHPRQLVEAIASFGGISEPTTSSIP